MAAPSIPNLLSLRNNTAAGRGRGKGQEAESPVPEFSQATEERLLEAQAKKDLIVQSTDNDANISRLSAVRAGYLKDSFAKEFAPAGEIQRRFPIINRGTYSRTTAVDRLVDGFLSQSPETQKQIISLGAGTDTRYFRLMSRPNPPNVLYHELDFAVNTQRKLSVIMNSPALKALVGDPIIVRWAESQLHGPHYHVQSCDLRSLDLSRPWEEPVFLHFIDPGLPTLLLSECCLTYLAPDAADSVVRYFATKAISPDAPLGIVLYEPIKPFDSFGKVMIANLAARGIVLQTLQKYCSLDAQRARLQMYGFKDGQRAVDMDFLYEYWIDDKEKRRVARVEMLDEVEELNLLAKHYCIAWGWRDGVKDEYSGVWEGWSLLEEQEE